jgi:hypothetical protein
MARKEDHPRYKHINRPRKTEAEKRRREKVWRKRLAALGLPEDKLAKMNRIAMRTALKRPAKVVAQVAKAKAKAPATAP